MNHLIFDWGLPQNDTYRTKPIQKQKKRKRITVKHITGLIHARTLTQTQARLSKPQPIH